MKLDVEYDRISEDKTHAGAGVDSQYEENVDFAEELGITFGRRYTDNDLSAFSGVNRPEYEHLLRDMTADLVRSITVWHANRLLRLTDELPLFMELAREHKVTLYSTTRGGAYNLETAAGRKALRDDISNAEYESEHRGERVTLARKRQARNADYGGGGVRPYGWGVDTGRVRSVCANPKAPTMDRVYEDRPVLDMGQHNQEEAAEIRKWAADLLAGVPINALLRDLRTRGVQTVSMKEGRQPKYGGKVTEHKGWSSRTIHQILTHPRTSGHAVYKGKIVRRNAYPSILPEDVRQALIALFSDPARKTATGNVPKWLGSLIFRCGKCNNGATMAVRLNCKGTPVYKCRDKGHCQWPAEPANAYVESVIVERLSRDDLTDLLPRKNNVDVKALREERKVIETRKREAARRHARGAIDDEMLEEQAAECNRLIEEIKEKLNGAIHESPLSPFVDTDDPQGTWDRLTIMRKREICKLLVSVTVYPIGRGGIFSTQLIDIEEVSKRRRKAT